MRARERSAAEGWISPGTRAVGGARDETRRGGKTRAMGEMKRNEMNWYNYRDRMREWTAGGDARARSTDGGEAEESLTPRGGNPSEP
jgi:hypothetical protein